VPQIGFRVAGHAAVITIDRPEARNAINPEVATGLEAAIDRLEEDESLRVGVLSGTPPVFCAGADLKAVGEGRGAELYTERGGFAGFVRRARTKPIIAAVDGPALAGGTELVLACDLVVASEAAAFGLPEVKRGLIASGGGLFRLPRALPRAIAMECALTGAPLSASLAFHHGLVNRLCPAGAAVDVALELAAAVAANAPLAVAASRRLMLESEEELWALTEAENAKIVETDDVREGVLAFVEKRAPVWSGR
jgi:enoyl-CoA hydratase